MIPPILNYESEFELMVKYQLAVESGVIIMENSKSDTMNYSLVKIGTPFPSYEEYLNGNDFNELEIIEQSNSINYLLSKQDQLRCVLQTA